MSKKTIILIMTFFITEVVWAQQQKEKVTAKSNCGCRFSSINQAGILEGESGTAFQLQSINGIQLGTWFTGIGAGLDYYRYRGIPLFLDLRKNILNRNRTPFLFADGGIHFAWVQDKYKTGWNRNEFSNGLYYVVGLGYRLGLRKNDAFVFSLGYSFKRMEEKRYSTVFCINPPCDEQLYETLNYGLRRVSLQLGFSF